MVPWLIITLGNNPVAPVVTTVDPDIARKIIARRKRLEAVRLAQEQAELRAREIRRKSLRDMVLGITESIQDVIAEAEAVNVPEQATAPLVESLKKLAKAKDGQFEERAQATEKIAKAFQDYLRALEDDEDDIEMILMEIF